MKSLKTFIFLIIFQTTLLSCKQTSSDNQGLGIPHIVPGGCNIGKWTGLSSPLNLKMSPEFLTDFTNTDLVAGLNPLEQMAKAWNDATSPTSVFQIPFNLTSTNGSAALAGHRDGEFGIYKSHDWFPGVSTSALAITQFFGIVRSDGNLGTYIDLTHADIIVNYKNFASELTMTGNLAFQYDLPTIVLHEMGHFLGLCHENVSNSIMAPYYFSTQRNLKTFDINKIKALYLLNQNYSALETSAIKKKSNGLEPVGSEVKGIIELNSNGHCRHFINGKIVYEHN
jgi:hypothetical protein